ncbi:MAG: hypothetical protein LBL17_00920 [Coxiellaceae bacterium]|jgi:hypothetical protein|nr:hypothetical protein [Coxiellaceae bacterium]
MSVSNGNFGNIETTGGKTNLTNSKVKNILVKKRIFGSQEIELNKTTTSGDVTFESDKGKIYLNKDSKIQGTVTDTITIIKK